MKYETRDKIGAFIWFMAYGVCIMAAMGIIFTPLILNYTKVIFLPLWLLIISMLGLTFVVFWFADIIELWLEQFEDWLRKKFNL